MDINEIYDTLLDNRQVAAVFSLKDNKYMDVVYECIISCELSAKNHIIPVRIGIPEDWEQKLIDIYIEEYSTFPYIPHVDIKGKMCLFDLEGALIDTNLCGLLNQCIERAILLLSNGLEGSNKEDFINEFSLYWSQLPEKRIIKCVIPLEEKTQKIKYVEQIIERRKNEKFSTYQKRTKLGQLFAASDTDSFSTWCISGTQKNGFYFCLTTEKYVYPPDAREVLKIEYINNLLGQSLASDCSKIMHKSGGDKVFIFQIKQPNGICICIGVLLKNAIIEQTDIVYQIKDTPNLKIHPLSVQRIDKYYLMNRTKDVAISDRKKLLLIGCGSIGGYLSNELVKVGFEDITFVDEDFLCEDNIFRHFLGIEYVGQYKAEALVKYFKKNIPHIKLKAVDENVKSLIADGSIELNDYDLIISATGNHNINRWINKIVYNDCIKIPIIYVWNEPLDIGCHVAVIRSIYTGCYECFFRRDILTQELYDATAYCAPRQVITRSYTGCGGFFVPYGSTISLKSTALCMDWINKALDGRCSDNVLISLKGEGYYFEKAGFKASDIYRNQTKGLEITIGERFQDKYCEICG